MVQRGATQFLSYARLIRLPSASAMDAIMAPRNGRIRSSAQSVTRVDAGAGPVASQLFVSPSRWTWSCFSPAM